jgi:hypothetical protein
METARIRRSPQVLSQVVEGETVLLDLASEHYFVLENAVGTRFWHLLDEHEDVEETIAVLLHEFEVDETTLRADIEALVSELRAAGLLADG